MTERDWRRSVDSVTHTCGCYLQSQRSRSARRGVITDPDVCQLFGLVGVPTIILLDSSGKPDQYNSSAVNKRESAHVIVQMLPGYWFLEDVRPDAPQKLFAKRVWLNSMHHLHLMRIHFALHFAYGVRL